MHSLTYLKTSIKNLPLIQRTFRLKRIFFGSRNAESFRHWQDYLHVHTVAGYIGFLGHNNLGDEALFLAFKKLFPKLQIIMYHTQDEPDFIRNLKSTPIELILYRKFIKKNDFYNFVFLGGGTLINRDSYLKLLRQAIYQGNPGVVFGTGVCLPSFWKERRPDIDYSKLMPDWISVLKDAAYVSVRGPLSANTLESYGLSRPKVIGDPALSICVPRHINYSRNRRIAINLGSHGFIWGNQEYINEVIAKLAHHLLSTGWHVEFIPMHSIDLEVGIHIIHKFNLHKVSIWKDFKNINKTLERIQTYDILIGQRLHSVVLACGCGVPAIMLEYQPKCGDFMESIGMERFALRTDTFTFDQILDSLDEIEMNYQEISEQLLSKCNNYRLLQQQAAQQVFDLVQEKMSH